MEEVGKGVKWKKELEHEEMSRKSRGKHGNAKGTHPRTLEAGWKEGIALKEEVTGANKCHWYNFTRKQKAYI